MKIFNIEMELILYILLSKIEEAEKQNIFNC